MKNMAPRPNNISGENGNLGDLVSLPSTSLLPILISELSELTRWNQCLMIFRKLVRLLRTDLQLL